MLFGIICEGLTDYHVLKHSVQAYFPNARFKPAQPTLDPREQKQVKIDQSGNVVLDARGKEELSHGGWIELIKFLKSSAFEDEIANTSYVVIQIDTDVCDMKGFDIPYKSLADTDHTKFYELIKCKIIEWMNSCGIPLNKRKKRRFIFYKDKRKTKTSLFDFYQDRIIFAISIHSLECWLLAYHDTRPRKCKITGCESALNRYLTSKGKSISKNAPDYITHSLGFKTPENHTSITTKSESFKIFVDQLTNISP